MDHRWPQFIIKTEDLFRADCGLKQQQSRLHKKEQGNRQGWESSQEDKLAWMGTKFGTISLCNQPKVRNSGTIRHKMTTRNSKSGYFSPTNWVKPSGYTLNNFKPFPLQGTRSCRACRSLRCCWAFWPVQRILDAADAAGKPDISARWSDPSGICRALASACKTCGGDSARSQSLFQRCVEPIIFTRMRCVCICIIYILCVCVFILYRRSVHYMSIII